jgi:hypothetical protein
MLPPTALLKTFQNSPLKREEKVRYNMGNTKPEVNNADL